MLVAANIALPKNCVPPGPLGALADQQITPEEMLLYFPDLLEPGTYQDGAKPMGEKEWRDAIAASHGLVPDYVERIVAEATAPVKDWKNELARFIHSTRKSDCHTWSRPSRRISGMPDASEIETTIVICIDTSGSIVGNVMGTFVTECRAILDLAGITAVVISADAKVQQTIQPGETFPTVLMGGGGTSFVPALEAAANYEPDGIVYFTDGEGTYPPSSQFPVLWALTKPCAVPFGEKILVEVAQPA